MVSAVHKLEILITGATGYIGGGILEALLRHADASSFVITAIVRDAEKARKLEELGVNTVVGSHSDAKVVEPLAEKADVIITAANVDDMDAAHAILRGLKRKYEATSKAPLLIHTSGTAVLADDAFGNHGTDTIYSDMNLPLLDSIPPSQPHRTVDLTVIEADKEGYVRAWIVIPSTIYGRAQGKLVDHGISNPKSQQIPRLVQIGLERGKAPAIGKGENYWPNVHIDDLVDLYVLLFDTVRSSTLLPSGREGLYFGAHGEHKLKQVYARIGEELHSRSKSESTDPSTLSEEEITKFFGPPPDGRAITSAAYGSNSRARADRGYALGWQPLKGTEDMLASIREEVEAVISARST